MPRMKMRFTPNWSPTERLGMAAASDWTSFTPPTPRSADETAETEAATFESDFRAARGGDDDIGKALGRHRGGLGCFLRHGRCGDERAAPASSMAMRACGAGCGIDTNAEGWRRTISSPPHPAQL